MEKIEDLRFCFLNSNTSLSLSTLFLSGKICSRVCKSNGILTYFVNKLHIDHVQNRIFFFIAFKYKLYNILYLNINHQHIFFILAHSTYSITSYLSYTVLCNGLISSLLNGTFNAPDLNHLCSYSFHRIQHYINLA